VETIAVLVAFSVVATAAIGAVVWMATKLVEAKNSEANARELAAQRTGDAQVDAVKVDDANRATATAAASANAQEQRGDALEKELAADAKLPPGATGVDQLRAQVAAVPGAGSPGNGGGAGKP